MSKKISASEAMLKVLEDWHVDHLFGLPGGSFDSTMDAIHKRQDTIQYIQVRHEEAGALAAAGEAKLSGKIGVTFGSAGPGAVHLLNGLYDAKHDHAPVLALVAQVPTSDMNTDYFQELNENPIFEDVSVYNRTVMTAEQLPLVIDQAIRKSYENSGVAVVTIPKDLGWQQIDDNFESTADRFTFTNNYPLPDKDSVRKAVKILTEAKRPLIYFGLGAKHAGQELKKLSEKLKIPLMSSAIAKGVIDDSYESYMLSAGRVASKPGVDAISNADAVLFIGTNMPFVPFFAQSEAKFIQVDVKPSNMGKRHKIDVGILADSKMTLQSFIELSEPVVSRTFYDALVADKKNWHSWLLQLENKKSTPLSVDSVFSQINKIAAENAIFAVDVGNVTIDSYRLLKMKDTQKITTSAWYATMGYAVPAAIAAKASYPERQVFSISGDGGFSMNMQDISTQVKYHQSIINIVLTNQSLGFIEGEQDDNRQPHSGVDLIDANFGDVAKALGATGFEVSTLSELEQSFSAVKSIEGPVVIDVKVSNDRPLPVEQLVLEPSENFDQDDVNSFIEKYHAEGLIPISHFINEYHVN